MIRNSTLDLNFSKSVHLLTLESIYYCFIIHDVFVNSILRDDAANKVRVFRGKFPTVNVIVTAKTENNDVSHQKPIVN